MTDTYFEPEQIFSSNRDDKLNNTPRTTYLHRLSLRHIFRWPSLSRPVSTTSSTLSSSGVVPLHTAIIVISSLVFTTLRDVSRLSPVPYLQEAATLALGIINIIQSMKECREGLRRLARDTCQLVYTIIEASSAVELPDIDARNIENLLWTLTSIHEFAHGQSKKGLFLRMMNHSSDRNKILEYRDALRQSLDVFGLQSTINNRANITRILQHQDQVARRLQDLGA